MTRVLDDQSLLPPGNETPAIGRPIIIVHEIDGGQGYIIDLAALDPTVNDPRHFGVVLSDLLDHIAAAYHRATGFDERQIRKHIAKVMRDENQLKAGDPRRGKHRGAMRWPTRQ